MLPCTVYLGRLLGLFRLILGVAESLGWSPQVTGSRLK